MTVERFFILAVLLGGAVALTALSGTTQIAWRGQPVSAQPDWQSNTLALINDAARGEGWNPWFSEWPNDVNHFAYQLASTRDANRVIERFAKIPGPGHLKLNPDPAPSTLGFTSRVKTGSGYNGLFSLGSQKRIDEWFAHLPIGEHGVRTFGVHRYTNAPLALPPTLTLYLRSTNITMADLIIPAGIKVIADVSGAPEESNRATVKRIEEFVAQSQSR